MTSWRPRSRSPSSRACTCSRPSSAPVAELGLLAHRPDCPGPAEGRHPDDEVAGDAQAGEAFGADRSPELVGARVAGEQHVVVGYAERGGLVAGEEGGAPDEPGGRDQPADAVLGPDVLRAVAVPEVDDRLAGGRARAAVEAVGEEHGLGAQVGPESAEARLGGTQSTASPLAARPRASTSAGAAPDSRSQTTRPAYRWSSARATSSALPSVSGYAETTTDRDCGTTRESTRQRDAEQPEDGRDGEVPQVHEASTGAGSSSG